MSCTVHFKGKLTPTGKTVEEYMSNIKVPSYYDDKREYLNDELQSEAIEIDNEVFTIEKNEYDDEGDIFESTKNKDATIDFQVKYHDGGCGFGEALEEALKQSSLIN